MNSRYDPWGRSWSWFLSSEPTSDYSH